MPETLWVLDTDHLSLHHRGHQQVRQRLLALPLKERATTIVSVEEQLRGRFAMIARARTAGKWVAAYSAFQQTLEDLMQLRLLPFDDSAAAEFVRLKASVKMVGTQDLKIAAIVLTVGGVLVTRNQRDFAALIIVSAIGQKNRGQKDKRRYFSVPYFSVGVSEWPKR